MRKVIYLDHAATTATRKEVIDEMRPYFDERFANPSNSYEIATRNKQRIEEARGVIASTINAKANDIYFTSGGSESDNWAIKGVLDANANIKTHIITSKIEHHAITNTCTFMEQKGYDVTYLDVDELGFVKLDQLIASIRPDTAMVSIMFANNEIGTIENIAEIGKIARKYGIIFHTDAVQAYGHVKIDVEAMNIDLLSASGHKFYGPKGTGFLYVRDNIDINNLIHGGKQETGKRAGTENVPGIVGIAKAAELAYRDIDKNIINLSKLRDYMINRILTEIPYCRLNGSRNMRLPNNVSITFQFVQSEAIIAMLDMEGICASAGSACSAGTNELSGVLTSIGLTEELAKSTVRFTLGEENTYEEIDYCIDKLKEIISNLRDNSEEYLDYKKRNNIQ